MKVGHPADKTPPVAVKNSSGTTPDATDASAQASASAIPAHAESSAKIELSSTAASLLKNESSPDFDAEKVNRISKQIADGSFKIDAHVIADKLIGNAKELLTKVQS